MNISDIDKNRELIVASHPLGEELEKLAHDVFEDQQRLAGRRCTGNTKTGKTTFIARLLMQYDIVKKPGAHE